MGATRKTLTLVAVMCLFLIGLTSASDPYVQYQGNVTLEFSARHAFFDFTNMFAYVNDGSNIVKLNATSTDTMQVLDSVSISIDDSRVRSDLYQSKGWLFVWNGYTLNKLNASDLSAGPIASLDLSANFSNSINNVVLDEARQLAFAINYHEGWVAIIDVAAMSLKSLFNFSTEYNYDNEVGAYPMVYDASRKALWIGVDCAYGIPSYIWQIDMSNVDAPSVASRTAFGGDSCFEGEPIIDPEGTGIVYFNDEDSNNVYGIRPDGSWGSDLFLPLPHYAEAVAVDAARKQAFYVSGYWCCYGNNYIYRACLNSRPVTYTTTAIEERYTSGVVYSSSTETLYVFDGDGMIRFFSITGTDCPQSSAEASSASTPVSAVSSLLLLSAF